MINQDEQSNSDSSQEFTEIDRCEDEESKQDTIYDIINPEGNNKFSHRINNSNFTNWKLDSDGGSSVQDRNTGISLEEDSDDESLTITVSSKL